MGASMRLRLVLALLCLAAAPPALAQQEPPARVGTVSYVSGNLAFHTAGDTQWSASGVNYPVATGGSFWTDPQARAQIQIGPSTIVMDGGTEIDVTNLNDQVAQLGVPQGRVHLHLRQLEAGQSFEIDVPQGAVWLLQPGSYDINAGSQDQGARVAVFAGSARFVGGGTDLGIHSGDAAMLSQTNPATVSTERAGSDAFVQWCTAHDYQENRLASPHYVSAQMTGYSDLDPYGNWQSNPQYGQVWYPSQTPADWAPYRDGRWIWVAPWGWTWVDQQPWGFAPFHYGRWAYVDDRWGWVPGSYVAQPVYAPALVAFVGLAAAGIAESAGAGPAVGWFPLAPGEVYWPSYTRNTAYIRNVNITNVKNINTVVNNTVINEAHGAAPPQVANANFANRRFATVVPQRVFASAAPVAPAVVHVPPAALQKAPVAVRPPQITPVVAHAAVAGPPRGAANAAPLGPNRPAPAGSGQPPHPGAAQEHPGAPGAPPGGPGARPANTAALPPPRPGEVRPAERNQPGQVPPGAATAPHGGPPGEAQPGHPTPPGGPVAHPANTAALPPGEPHPGAARPGATGPAAAEHGEPPAAAHPEHPGTPNTAALPPPHPGTAAPREARPPAPGPTQPPVAAPERRPPPAAELHPAAAPRPAAPPPHPPAQAQIVHPPAPPAPHPPAQAQIARPPAPRPPVQAVHPPAPPPAPHPAPAAVHPAAAAPHPAPQPPHPQPAPAHGGKPPPKDEEKHG
jgi:hypothetical protein